MKKSYYAIIKNIVTGKYDLIKTNRLFTRNYGVIGSYDSYESAELKKGELVK